MAAAKKGGLGKGLDSLIADKVSKTVAPVTIEKSTVQVTQSVRNC